MLLRTTVRDCLYLNWALPAAALPAPVAPLRYQLHSWQGDDYVFASALLFYQEGLHLPALPLLWVSFPQANVRLYVLDGDGVPSVLFRRLLMPAWLAPGVRLVAGQPAASARLDFPRPSRLSRTSADGRWRWRVRRGGTLEVTAWQDSPGVGQGPRLGNWEQTVEYFQERPRGYTEEDGVLRRIEASHPPAAVWPLKAEIGQDGLLPSILPLGEGVEWPALHSSWLCPEIPFVLQLGYVPKLAVAPGVPQAAASRGAAAREEVQVAAADAEEQALEGVLASLS